MTLESDIEHELCRWVGDRGGLCLKLKLENARGIPDRLVLLNGRAIFVELKRSDGVISPHQQRWLKKLSGQGFDAWVIRSVEEFEKKYEAA